MSVMDYISETEEVLSSENRPISVEVDLEEEYEEKVDGFDAIYEVGPQNLYSMMKDGKLLVKDDDSVIADYECYEKVKEDVSGVFTERTGELFNLTDTRKNSYRESWRSEGFREGYLSVSDGIPIDKFVSRIGFPVTMYGSINETMQLAAEHTFGNIDGSMGELGLFLGGLFATGYIRENVKGDETFERDKQEFRREIKQTNPDDVVNKQSIELLHALSSDFELYLVE